MTVINEVHFEGKIAQKVIIVKDGKVLLLRDARMQEVIWELPGGRLNIDEEPRAGVAREIMEELRATIAVGEVVYMGQFLQGSERNRAFIIVYKATLIDETADFVLLTNEVSEIAWVTKDDLKKYPLFPSYARALNCYFEKYAN